MKHIVSIFGLLAILLHLTTACVEDPQPTFEELEQRSLKAWIEKYRPELLENYQEEGGYYVEVLDEGVRDSLPVTGKDVWLWCDFTGRDLRGNVCETRDWTTAYQQGTFTLHTHYTPIYRFSGKESFTHLEGTYLATYNELNIGGEKLSVRYGTKLRLYLPSSIISADTGVEADGGYEGQFKLDGNKPMIVDMTIYGHVDNPVAYEGNRIDSFAALNGGLCTEHRTVIDREETDAKSSAARLRRTTRGDAEGDAEGEGSDTRPLEFFDGRWHQPVDTLAHLYVNYAYSPARTTLNFNTIAADTMMYPGEALYDRGTLYGSQSMADIDRRINEALVERFGEGITYDEVLTADSLNAKATANVWYIGRFLDGYVFDTNIDEVKEIVFGGVEASGSALSFNTADPEDNDYILAWNYSLPTLRRGQWATILTVSTYGYGIAGQVGSHTASSDGDQAYYDYLNYMNYMNYMNNYYGNGYGGMYNGGYYGYTPYYYGYPASSTEEEESVVITSSEVGAYTPLLFQVFVAK